MEAWEGSGGFGLGRILPERGGGRSCRSWGRGGLWPTGRRGASYGSNKAADEPRHDREGDIYIARGGRPRWRGIGTTANRRSVAVRATWWRLAGSGGRAGEDGRLTRAVGERRRLGRRRPGRGALWPAA